MAIVLKGAKLFDGTGKDIITDGVVVIGDDGKIDQVGKRQDVSPIKYDEVSYYDLNGQFLMPGLIDAHIHIGLQGMPDTYQENYICETSRAVRSVKEMEATLQAGFTTVRNCGTANKIDFSVKEGVENGWINGPRILTSGEILSTTCSGTEYFENLYRIADGYDEFKKASREQLKFGADFLKVMATGAIMNPGGIPGAEQTDIKELKAIVEEATKLEKKVAAHAHGAQGIKNAVQAGAYTIEHASLVDDEALSMMVDHNIYVVPTLTVGYLVLKYANEINVPRFMIDKTRQIRTVRVNSIKRALESGVRIAMGSDAGVSPYNYHGNNALELVIYVNEGLMSPTEAILSATKVAAEACDIASEVGTIEKGKIADMIVVDGNPLEDIEVLLNKDNIRKVIKDGKIVKNLDKESPCSIPQLTPYMEEDFPKV
ncbi:putative amidohydrolase [Candidatus Syntrophocurvum alkaliphilum]|uniref:Putative amidohydrolase n=1 Tax=Candidatus Syntrophocurvum alkaliphilum TaxID=2293317 RepID=A0A6I6DHW9_9FIRM|nr:amidohydrolase family protein [Candidatus Syntrophocurvum alkaliphilum]QGU00369.1 putative amidohydrolase [Candidatus Syntrophocurvum alkaliphilum]